MDPQQMAEALDHLNGWANEAGAHMTRAAELILLNPAEAPEFQSNAMDSLDRIFNTVAPFSPLLDRAVKTEQALVDVTSALVETPDEAPEISFQDLAWQQKRVTEISTVMPVKAQQMLEQIEAMGAAGMQGGMAGNAGAQGVDPQQMQEQQDAMKRAMEKAIELSPRIEELTREAAESLDQEDAGTALPSEEEALKLLKEIAEEMPKQDQQQQGQDQQEQQPQDDQQDQQQQQQQQQQREKPLTQQEAENLLQKAKEQEKEYRKKTARPVAAPGSVDKDW